MSRNSSFYAAFLCALCCSGAVALQPTVRAGSLSLNSGVKPTAGAVTSTTQASTAATNDASRGSTLSKFMPGTVVPVSRTNNNSSNNQASSAALDDLREQIRVLREAQLGLENNQMTQSAIERTIEDTVKTLDLTTTNNSLKNTLTDLQRQSTTLQTDVSDLQQQAAAFDTELDTNLDNRLKVRGLIGGDNKPPFALKTEVTPTALANTIAGDINATNTLSNKIKPKRDEIEEIIQDNLISKEILTGGGELNVEKKGQVVVSPTTVTNALRESTDFKQMVLDEIAEKGGYVTTTALNESGFVTSDALDRRNFLSTDSATFTTLATKNDIAPSTLVSTITDSNEATGALVTALSGKVGPNADRVDELITQKLKSKGLVTDDNNATRAVLTAAELETTLTSKGYATEAALDPKVIAKSIAESSDAKQELAGQIGTSEADVKDILVRKGLLKNDETLNVAPVSLVATVDRLGGSINEEGSLLKTIADSESLRELLRGPAGKDGTGYTIVGSADTYTIIRNKTCNSETKGNAWVNLNTDNADDTEGRLYICACDGASCTWPALGQGIKIKGEKGDPGDPGTPAETAWKTYCTSTNEKEPAKTNLEAIIKPLYGDGKTCDTFTKDEYTALLDGAKAYCTLIAQEAKLNPTEFLASDKAKNLQRVLGATALDSLTTNGVGATAYVFNRNMKVVDLCTQSYNDIMNPETAWYSYCNQGTNLTSIIQPLYGSNKTCDNFTSDEYNALMGGSKEYCMLIAKNAKTDQNYLVASKGIGKTLEEVFGTGTVNNLKNNGISASVSLGGNSQKFVFACAEKYDEIMNPKSAWYSYCTEGTNLTSIIQPLYGSSTVPDCKSFTQEQYNALMGGPKSYCLLVAKDVSSSTANVKSNLKKLFGDNIVTTLSSQKVATTVTLDGENMKFVDACAKKYEEIMAGKSGEGYNYRGEIDTYSQLSGKTCDIEHEKDAWYNLTDKLLYICACNNGTCAFPANGKGADIKGTPGENAKPASQVYCEAQADNYPSGTKNLTLIQKLYPENGITSCDPSSFTADMYAAVIGGAKSYCLSLNADFNSGMSLEEGVGLKMAKIYAQDKLVSLSAAKTALGTLQAKTATERLNDANFSILDKCIANYNRIMSGDDAEDPWYIYCTAQNEKDNTKTNLQAVITPLYGHETCDTFTKDEYSALMDGAKAYCTLIAQEAKMNKSAFLLTDQAKNLKRVLGETALTNLTNSGVGATVTINNQSVKVVDECTKRYNDIMNPETAWHAYCTAQNDKDTNKTNLEVIIKPLYGNSKTCDNFTSDEYNAIMGGAKAYCLSLAQNAPTMDLTSGIGEKLSKTFGSATMTTFKETASLTDRMSLKTFTGKTTSNKDFVSACEERYNEIMNPETSWHAYCVETDGNNVSNLTKIIRPLYGNGKTCDNFTSDEYNAIMGGAKAYCLSLAKDGASLDLTAGIGKKLSDVLGATKMSNFKQAASVQDRINMTGFQGVDSNKNFVSACEEKYNEIMAGDKGDSGDDAATVWCKEHTTGTATSTAKMSAAKMVRAFDKLGGNSTAASKINTSTGRFNSLQDCIDAVRADPSLMGGESAADEDFNEDNKGTTITLNSDIKTALEGKKTKFQKVVTEDNIGEKLPDTVVTTGNAETKLGNKFATKTTVETLSNNVVTKTGLATELGTTSAQDALARAGFATKSNITNEVKGDVFTLGDFTRLLSGGGLEVDNQGKLKLADTTTNAAAANINAKLTAAKTNDASIQTTGLTATTNITSSIASVAASATVNETINSSDECNKHEYMYWTGSKCEKCPDGTYFDKTAGTRCVCKDATLTFSDGSCVPASMGQNDCFGPNGANLYFNGTTCVKCPSGTYFNEASLNNNTLPRCICEDKSLEFDANQGKCTAASSCAATETVMNLRSNKCQECPGDAPFSAEINSCTCPAGMAFNAYRWACADCGSAGAEYNQDGKSCVCPAGSGLTLNQEQWKCQ